MTTARMESKGKIDRGLLLLSAQRALLGAIGGNVIGIYVDPSDDSVEMVAFIEGPVTSQQREDLDVATTEISADFSFPLPVCLQVVENAKRPLCGSSTGIWVFLRSGYTVR
jgi:hypothetical protein